MTTAKKIWEEIARRTARSLRDGKFKKYFAKTALQAIKHPFLGHFQQFWNKKASNKALHRTSHKVRRPVTADVRERIIIPGGLSRDGAMAKQMPDLRMKTEQPSNHKNKPEQGVAPYGAQSAPRLNADVGGRNI